MPVILCVHGAKRELMKNGWKQTVERLSEQYRQLSKNASAKCLKNTGMYCTPSPRPGIWYG